MRAPTSPARCTSGVRSGVRLWDPATVLQVAFSPDGTRLAVAEAAGVRVHTLHPGT
ncbi:hypothetical protein [Streptomyces sp. DSM 40907]|uniref:hypothetical protein n=1 Tax=Streptomyces kutzneri TaxID=3051179 RepID=UPI0028D6639B|nr:hypothetical protein [Streptomyces sp. DSM 40907]